MVSGSAGTHEAQSSDATNRNPRRCIESFRAERSNRSRARRAAVARSSFWRYQARPGFVRRSCSELHFASMRQASNELVRAVDMFRCLFDAAATSGRTAGSERRPLWTACTQGHTDIVQVLLGAATRPTRTAGLPCTLQRSPRVTPPPCTCCWSAGRVVCCEPRTARLLLTSPMIKTTSPWRLLFSRRLLLLLPRLRQPPRPSRCVFSFRQIVHRSR